MNYEEITLSHFFREQDWHDEKLSKIELKGKVTELKAQINKKEPGLKWENIYREIIETGSNLLKTKLKDILENTWQKYSEVKQYLDEEKYNSEETFLIPLLEHTVVSEHHPKIEIRIGDVYIGKIDFEVNLKLLMSGIILKISQGKIQGVKAGKCKSNGTFLCEGITLFEDENSEFSF
ncbi:MAG: hypothetical protein HN778_01850 [Prolixibacteraceae bacterium]|jgi:hypothetical protein|nr:hypothetical protein [Prolixibacteraceae bacterium]MBT6005855.1 hypothetical protein [Prolixibacteraceae bacterium]MBT6764396.1 hypothetical protein [Prolixibacteraceae bacterium]MBT7038916.1 hypothetical protein [Bacteroidota bacterium]MBT7393554.1 hypothetical protein [Prolixibacteraceae bacterium]